MKIRLRHFIFTLAVAIALFAAIVIGILWPPPRPAAPQFINVPGAGELRFVGITYGTNHNSAILFESPLTLRLADHLPTLWLNFVRKAFGKGALKSHPWASPEPMLRLWFAFPATNFSRVPWSAMFPVELADEQGTVAVAQSVNLSAGHDGLISIGLSAYDLAVVPRRSPTWQFILYATNGAPNAGAELGRVRFPNPLFAHYPEWQPETVPVTKHAGDVPVQLDWFGSHVDANTVPPQGLGHRMHSWGGVTILPTPGRDEKWIIERGTLGDATGNVSMLNLLPPIGVTNDCYFIASPWPYESAWRLHLELRRATNFSADELVTFPDVPIPAVNGGNRITNTFCQTRVVLWVSAIPSPSNPHLFFDINLPDQPPGVTLNFVAVKPDGGEGFDFRRNERAPQGVSVMNDYERQLGMPLTNAAEKFTLTLSLQKTRAVDFFVKPPTP